MNCTRQIFAMILISYAGWSFAAGDEQPLAVKTDGLPLHVAQRVKERAADGVTSLRRYIYITRAMHGLDMRALVVRHEPATQVVTAPNGKSEKVSMSR